MATNNSTDTSNPMTVSQGGTGDATLGAYEVLVAGTTSTAAVQSVSGLGIAGEVLTSQGASALPIWAANPGGTASWVNLGSQTASNSANISFTTGISSTYNSYFFVMSAVVPVTNGANFIMQVSTNGGSSYINSGYHTGVIYYYYITGSPPNWASTSSSSTTAVLIAPSVSSTAGLGVSGNLNCHNVTNASSYPFFDGTNTFNYSAISYIGANARMGGSVATANVNAFQFTMSTGNISSGTITLYGVSQ